MNIAEQVEQVLATRRAKLPQVRDSRAGLEALERSLAALQEALAALGRDPRAPGELRAVIAGADLQSCRRDVQVALDEVARVEARFGRPTINLGVSGQARVGKSTLLQALSGLDDQAIPTGTGTPVTAVRSRILNRAERVARLQMHSWDSFRDEVLAPYHADLGLGLVPATLDAFHDRSYPAPAAEDENSRNVMLKRLRAMRDSLGSYERYLTGAERIVPDFSELRAWVAYPKGDAAANADCRYLAVRQAVIECPFPHAAAQSIGLVDLPGLGEIAASAEAHHVKGLRDEVDFVVLVKRANEGMAYWTAQDARARKLVDEARKPISKTSDFLGIVSNEGSVGAETLAAMLASVESDANVGLEHAPIPLFRCDGEDPDDVGRKLLLPALGRLAESLPRMDTELLRHAQELAVGVAEGILGRLQGLEAAMTASLPEVPGTAERLYEVTRKLREDIALALTPILVRYRARARAEGEDPVMSEAIAAAHAHVHAWALDALGVGEAKWMERALGAFAVDRSPQQFGANELNRIRVHIGEVYCGLDGHLQTQTSALFDEIGDALAARLGRLLQGLSGREALVHLVTRLEAGDESCPNLRRATEHLLGLQVSYRSHFHPIVRARLDILDQFYRDAETGELVNTIPTLPPTGQGAVSLLRELRNLAVKASASVRDGLLREAALMDKILHAAAEQFEDSVIRSGTSQGEFARFTRSWRDELFPGQFDGTSASRLDARAARSAFANARGAIDSIKTGADNE